MHHSIRSLAVAAWLALAVGSAPAMAQVAPSVVLEGSVETSTEQVIFPLDQRGRLQVRDCGGCLHATLQLDANTQFNLGGTLVSVREMADYALRNPGHSLTIHYRLKDLITTRVTVLSK